MSFFLETHNLFIIIELPTEKITIKKINIYFNFPCYVFMKSKKLTYTLFFSCYVFILCIKKKQREKNKKNNKLKVINVFAIF